jgi:phasin
MSETMQARASKTSRAPASAAEDNPATLRTELPSSFIDLFEKSIARAKDAHEKMTSIVEHSTEALEEAFSCANRGSAEYRVKLMEIARANANSAFDLAREVFEAKSTPELFESALAHQRKQFEAAAAQIKELSALTQKVVSETTAPIRSGMTEPFKLAS